MSDGADYWRDVKAHFKRKQNRYEKKISSRLSELIAHPNCKKVGDHWRIDEWDFWYTGTVMNPRTKEYSSIPELTKKYLQF